MERALHCSWKYPNSTWMLLNVEWSHWKLLGFRYSYFPYNFSWVFQRINVGLNYLFLKWNHSLPCLLLCPFLHLHIQWHRYTVWFYHAPSIYNGSPSLWIWKKATHISRLNSSNSNATRPFLTTLHPNPVDRLDLSPFIPTLYSTHL